ncbi:hypothetical protein HCN44_011337 [Aphidius gifuensis]|uniref:Peptidase S1 domain-containing protein n=1 Tax=Aphidius gifuensis TaxID=684658 RepID=A0A835CU79_APHGI|nr:hypothetical protein HCN44_011337 [Aphidius gifuensis]
MIFVVDGKVSRKIKGGENVPFNIINFQVSVQINNRHICSGIIIGENWILTSATCVILDNNVVFGNIKIRAGSNDLSDIYSCSISFYDVSLVIIYPEFDVYDFWVNDICLLKLSTEMIIDKWHVNIARIVQVGEAVKHRLHVSGWGEHRSDGSSNPHYLQRISIERTKHEVCFRYYHRLLDTNQFCAFGVPRSSSVTQGDSGSPICDYRKIYGVVSILLLLNDGQEPFLYTKVVNYNYWIEEIKLKY